MDKAKIKKFAIEARQKLIADIKLKMSNIGVTEKGISDPLPQSTPDAQFFDVGTSQPFALYSKDIPRRQMLAQGFGQGELAAGPLEKGATRGHGRATTSR